MENCAGAEAKVLLVVLVDLAVYFAVDLTKDVGVAESIGL